MSSKLDHDASRALWRLLTAMEGVEDEWERVRMAATVSFADKAGVKARTLAAPVWSPVRDK